MDRKRFLPIVLIVLIVALMVSMGSQALVYRDFRVPMSTFLANGIIRVQEPLLYLYRNYWHSGVALKSCEISGKSYSYLIRPGETDGILVLVHGVLARKEFYLSLITELVKRKQPLPTIVVPDLLGHGSQSYPPDYRLTVQAFVRDLGVFIKAFRKEYAGQKTLILGHSLGGGFSLLLKPFEGIHHDGLILVSPAVFRVMSPTTSNTESSRPENCLLILARLNCHQLTIAAWKIREGSLISC